jgi:hypothetical protein
MEELLVAATQKLLDGAFSVACDVLAARVSAAPKRPKDHQAEGQARRPETMPRLVVPAQLVHQAIADHLAQCKTWSSTVTFADLARPKELQKIHVELDTYVVPALLSPQGPGGSRAGSTTSVRDLSHLPPVSRLGRCRLPEHGPLQADL